MRPAPRQYSVSSSKRQRYLTSDGFDHRAYPFAPLPVGQADDGDFGDLRVLIQEILDVLGADVLALADDDVLDAPGGDHVAVGPDMGEIAGAVVAVGIEGGGGE